LVRDSTINFYQYKKCKKGGGWLKTLINLSLLLFFTLFSALFSFPAYTKEKPLVSLKQSAEQVWQRQQVLLTLTAKSGLESIS